ncbi:hypothetical protein WR25_24984 [Diploscapter pachys]|uniref:Uncharacterized protein n=1 Tax=Diploscapter pachys TaxID=2018661 RepID=A0A2A2M497_9BILA|nr:hypothetical protein WR25_24984 [Diploscapter pachys]
MPRPRRAVQPVADAGDADVRRKAFGVHHLDRRRPQQVAAMVGEQPRVRRLAPGIAGKVFVRAELLGVDEDRCDHLRARAPRRLDQRHMARVQRAHRRHQRDGRPFGAECGDRVAQAGQVSNCLHRLPPRTMSARLL